MLLGSRRLYQAIDSNIKFLTVSVSLHCYRVPRSCRSQARWFSFTQNAASSQSAADGAAVSQRRANAEALTRDGWSNTPPQIFARLDRRLHLEAAHPISLTRRVIEQHFPSPIFKHHNELSPVVSVRQNFDSLGFAEDHPGRSRSDTYYLNAQTCLRTHTSAHQLELFTANNSDGYTITADVYRRDAIDRSHFPVFHQMEGARLWDRDVLLSQITADNGQSALRPRLEVTVEVEDVDPPFHEIRNPRQKEHTEAEAREIAAHLKRTLEQVLRSILGYAQEAVAASSGLEATEPIRARWVETSFPFTSPSWELEVWWKGDWLEILGCGVVKHDILRAADVPHKAGWAFGIGLERIAMLLYGIPDIRLFWSLDPRFLGQFRPDTPPQLFVPFSKYQGSTRDVSFWLPPATPHPDDSSKTTEPMHENDVMEVIRGIGGNAVEDVTVTDRFTHPRSGRKSLCFRILYRDLERNLPREETNKMHEEVEAALVDQFGVELR